MPGVLFSATGKFGNYLRLNCSNAWTLEVEQAVRTLGELIERRLQSPARSVIAA